VRCTVLPFLLHVLNECRITEPASLTVDADVLHDSVEKHFTAVYSGIARVQVRCACHAERARTDLHA
jgi:hypothetical protein